MQEGAAASSRCGGERAGRGGWGGERVDDDEQQAGEGRRGGGLGVQERHAGQLVQFRGRVGVARRLQARDGAWRGDVVDFLEAGSAYHGYFRRLEAYFTVVIELVYVDITSKSESVDSKYLGLRRKILISFS